MDDQYNLFYTKDDLSAACNFNFWAGFGIGTLTGIVLLFLLGTYLVANGY